MMANSRLHFKKTVVVLLLFLLQPSLHQSPCSLPLPTVSDLSVLLNTTNSQHHFVCLAAVSSHRYAEFSVVTISRNSTMFKSSYLTHFTCSVGVWTMHTPQPISSTTVNEMLAHPTTGDCTKSNNFNTINSTCAGRYRPLLA